MATLYNDPAEFKSPKVAEGRRTGNSGAGAAAWNFTSSHVDHDGPNLRPALMVSQVNASTPFLFFDQREMCLELLSKADVQPVPPHDVPDPPDERHHDLLRKSQRFADRCREAHPPALLVLELPSSRWRDGIETGFPTRVGRSPRGAEPFLLRHPLQGWIKGPLFDAQ